MKPTTNKNNQPNRTSTDSPVIMDSTVARYRKVKPAFDMGVSDKRAAMAFKLGGTSIE